MPRWFLFWLAMGSATLGLGACSEAGDNPVQLFEAGDYARALRLFQAQARTGDIRAQNYLGLHYYLGAGVAREFDTAAQWFSKAARGGNADAQKNLGVLYLRGLGVEQDNQKAYAWLFQAWKGGNENARDYLIFVEHSLTPNQSQVARRWIHAQMRQTRSE